MLTTGNAGLISQAALQTTTNSAEYFFRYSVCFSEFVCECGQGAMVKDLKKKKRLKIKDSKIGKGMSRNTSFYLIIVAKINYMSLAFCKISNYK